MKNYTDITFILDRSGSMASTKDDVIGGFNQFIEDQKKEDGHAELTLLQFDMAYELNYEAVDIQNVEPLNDTTYVPRGGTALLDAIGRRIVETGERLRGKSELERPDKVMFIIFTDGLENGSREYDNKRIKEMISEQTDQWNWDFMYMGANQDAFGVARTMGISLDKSMTFSDSSVGKGAAFRSLSSYTGRMRKTGQAEYSAEERKLHASIVQKEGK